MDIGKTSLIVTTYNEEKTIGKLIDSIAKQSRLPSEIIIVDGVSRDKTIKEIEKKQKQFKNKLKIKVTKKRGNRSVGRNKAIEQSKGDIILCTDAGCILEKDWVKNITKPFENKNVDVIAGYYKGKPSNIFQKCLIPYVLVMEDKIQDKFLPATRSMAFRKRVWEKTGGFNESLSHNEDYAFAKKLEKNKSKIIFAKDAIVYWVPRKNLKEAFTMFFRFSLGDVQANIIREKVILIFFRYIFMTYLLFITVILKSLALNIVFVTLILLYLAWSISKNYKYVKNYKAFFYLPLFQLTSDLAVIFGSSLGLIQKINFKKTWNILVTNKWLFVIILFYSTLMFLFLGWGVPSQNHPFSYAMDEWHFSQALRTFIKDGTGSVSGAASIPFYHIVSSILFLFPFYLLNIVNPLVIKFTLDNLPMQQTLFEVLRLHTLFYGILSTIVMYNLLKNFIKPFPIIFSAFFVFNPIWISLTNYYKYDITLSFWIITTLYLLIKYFKTQKLNYFIFAGMACGLALSTKFTALPLFVAYFLGYFILSDNIKYKQLATGVFFSLLVFAFFGIPDLIFGKGNYNQLLYSTLIQSPGASANFNLGYPSWFFLLFKEFPSMFGYFLSYLFYWSLLFWGIFLPIRIKKIKQYKLELFIFSAAMFFLLSIIPFGIDGGGNRALVLLPFMIILPGLLIKKMLKLNIKFSKFIFMIFFLGLVFQIIQSASWISVKFFPDPRETSSLWIQENISVNSEIGLENIPIYQMLPDFVLKEYYFKQHFNYLKTRYRYSVVSSKDKIFPKYIIISNSFDILNYIGGSPKKDLVNKLHDMKYNKIKDFSPNLKYYNIFADYRYFILANIMPIPVNISIYEK